MQIMPFKFVFKSIDSNFRLINFILNIINILYMNN